MFLPYFAMANWGTATMKGIWGCRNILLADILCRRLRLPIQLNISTRQSVPKTNPYVVGIINKPA